jgi:hypothetical protein
MKINWHSQSVAVVLVLYLTSVEGQVFPTPTFPFLKKSDGWNGKTWNPTCFFQTTIFIGGLLIQIPSAVVVRVLG